MIWRHNRRAFSFRYGKAARGLASYRRRFIALPVLACPRYAALGVAEGDRWGDYYGRTYLSIL